MTPKWHILLGRTRLLQWSKVPVITHVQLDVICVFCLEKRVFSRVLTKELLLILRIKTSFDRPCMIRIVIITDFIHKNLCVSSGWSPICLCEVKIDVFLSFQSLKFSGVLVKDWCKNIVVVLINKCKVVKITSRLSYYR